MKKISFITCTVIFLSIGVSPSYSADLAFDPTRPSAYVAPKIVKRKVVKSKPVTRKSGHALQTILIGETRRVATIDNKTYAVGEKLESGWVLTAITPHYVEIERFKKKKKIPLFKTQIRQ